MISRPLQALRRVTPPSFRFQIWQARMLRGHPDISALDVEHHYARITAAIDLERLERLEQAHRDATHEVVDACDYAMRLRMAIVKALIANVHRRPSCRVLDIGSGGGYFVAVCRMFGHDAEGTEVPVAHLSPRMIAVYAELAEALRVPCSHRVLIEAFKPIELVGTYDVVNAHKISFNDHGRPTEWGPREWDYFLTDALRLVTPGGELRLELNDNLPRYGARRWYDAAQLALFSSRGLVRDNVIMLRGK